MAKTWLESDRPRNDHTAELRRRIAERRTVPVAGVYDGLSAMLAARAGFEALYLSGAALSASMGLADLGLLTLDDVLRTTRTITRVVDRPLIVDGDTGFGEALNVMRAVYEMEQAGAACLQIEDQEFPKKCGHLSDKRLVEPGDMCRKVAAARRASRNLLICARTDAAAVSIDEAISRANAYHDAGADIIFVEAPTALSDMQRIRNAVSAPLMGNMTEFGRTPFISATEWEQLAYELVIFPVSSLRVSARALENFYSSLYADGDVSASIGDMMTRRELYDVINYFGYEALDETIVRSVLPED